MSKFSQLSSFGYNTSLKFECRDGKVHVDFTADLGYAPQYFPQYVHDIQQSNFNYSTPRPNRRHRKPRKGRNKKGLSTADINSDESCQNSVVSTDSIPEQELASIPLEPSDENLDEHITYHNVDAKCENSSDVAPNPPCNASACDNSNACVKFGTDEHNDLISNFFSSPSFGPLAPPLTSVETADGQQCRFCDEDFSCWENFATHVRKFSFICNNCLDYFPYKPWFLVSELSRVDAGIGDYFYLNQP